jgi:hypothetical protein
VREPFRAAAAQSQPDVLSGARPAAGAGQQRAGGDSEKPAP